MHVKLMLKGRLSWRKYQSTQKIKFWCFSVECKFVEDTRSLMQLCSIKPLRQHNNVESNLFMNTKLLSMTII